MSIEIKVPLLPESITDATVSKWYKQPGDTVARDESLVDLETDKVMLEVPAPADGVLKEILKPEGETVLANDVIGIIGEVTAVKAEVPAKKESEKEPAEKPVSGTTAQLSPALRRLVAEHNLDISQIKGTGKDGRITKEDVKKLIHRKKEAEKPTVPPELPITISGTISGERVEKRVPMSRLRARIAERLLDVKQTTAMLTTFNEVNMQPVMELREKYKEQFEKTHGVKLGFMSFFVKSATEALKRFPAVNACIDGSDIVYHGFFDIGIAVSTERGLVVPVVRDTDKLTMAQIELQIIDYARKARDAKLTIEEMTGGTFTITNGGIFGSLLATPILNPPQSAILGMHNIVKRPVVENDEIKIRPMMYVAMSYDHCIIDGRDSVQFLLTIKQLLEDPVRLILDL